MNKFKPLFNIPLAKYDNMDEYPPTDEIKRVLKAYLINHPNAPKKPTASSNAPATANNTTAGKNNKSKDKKRKRDENKGNNKGKLSKLSNN
jgi:N-acetylmuramoyl-L-alanine amidase CwlA